MNRGRIFAGMVFVALAPLLSAAASALLAGCGDDTSAASTGGDASHGEASSGDAGQDASLEAGQDGSLGDASGGDAGQAADAPSETASDAGCSHDGDPDATTKTIDAGAPLTFFDVGQDDLRLGLTSNGATALIADQLNNDVYFYDTATGVLTKRAHVDGDPSTAGATSIAGNGNRVSALHGTSAILAGIWDQCTGWTDIANPNATGCPGPPDEESGAFGLNADGTVAVGNAWNGCHTDAMLWTNANGAWTPTLLHNLGMTNASNRGTVVSDDGKVIGGFVQVANADRSPAVWQSNGTGTLLDPSGMVVGEVMAMSPDGKMAAGQWNTLDDAGTPVNTSFYWTSQSGVVLVGTLPNPQAQDMVWLKAIAANNKLIVGSAGDPSWSLDLNGTEEFAVVWTAAGGMRKLQDIVAAQKIAIHAGYDLTTIMAASADGTVLLGSATDMNDPNLAQHTFVLRMPVSAYGL
jgi:hypothetical protein